ncbi:MAG: hypothetical protein JRI79_15655 [Deltaproteobacteria bacterium]|nr:hypothetical protein [Deltaproteobacteria bacterium]MBW1979380.1 hypothetical protein [Deltaproteobacteria bacterium]MBW2300637.1 hypothetical protein [Deltaproteobacteria bacterium]
MNEDSRMWRSIKKLTKAEPIDPEQVGVDSRFILSSHYELVMPGTYYVEHVTGIKAWSEPALVLVVLLNHPAWPSAQQHVLYYGLSRSFFSSGVDPSDEGRTKLMGATLPILKGDIGQIGNSDVRDSLPKTKFVQD